MTGRCLSETAADAGERCGRGGRELTEKKTGRVEMVVLCDRVSTAGGSAVTACWPPEG